MDGGPQVGEAIHVLPEDLAPALSDTELIADIWAADAREARYVAERAVAVARFARRRRRQRTDEFGPKGGPGLDSRYRQPSVLADYSETFVAELAVVRCCSEVEAETLAVESLILTTRLTGTWSALYEGRIDVRKMRALVDLLGAANDTAIAAVEARVLPVADRLTVAQLRSRVRRALARYDAAALDARRAEASQRADVRHQPTADGMSRLVVDLPLFQAAACVDAVRQYADLKRADGDERPIGMIRAEVAAALILRPWDDSRPPVTAQLTVHAPLAALRPDAHGSADIAGEVVTAAQCRELLEEVDMLGVRRGEGCVRIAVGDPVTGRLVALATPRELRRGAGRGRRRTRRGLDPRVRDRDGLRPLPPTTSYRPSAGQRRFVEARDRTCRMPGCRRAPGRCDIDHAVAHADGGATACWNLCCLCRRHHRIKTFPRNWHFELLEDGRLIVRTPSGVSRVTRPPGWTYEVEPDPPWLDEEAPPDLLRC